jgi:hypothetical protein
LRGALQSHLAFQFVRRCTIAHNASAGFRDGAVTSTSIVSSILWANADDLVFLPGAAPGVSYSDVSDGDFAGANGNFSAEPRFVDPAGVDYRLQWGSLCIEAGDPATPAGALDLAGLARPIDGNLDTVEAPDVGAYEFAPLYPRGSGRIGSYFTLELWGAAGSATSLWWTRGTTVSPSATPFGELDLDPTTMRLLFSGAASPGPPSVWTRRIPDDPTLIGRSFAFQSLTDCAAAPLGRAWTNAVVLHVVP